MLIEIERSKAYVVVLLPLFVQHNMCVSWLNCSLIMRYIPSTYLPKLWYKRFCFRYYWIRAGWFLDFERYGIYGLGLHSGWAKWAKSITASWLTHCLPAPLSWVKVMQEFVCRLCHFAFSKCFAISAYF